MRHDPKAFTMSGDRARYGGKMVFRDWYSGMILDERWTGEYVSYDIGQASLMETWFDRETGERAFKCVKPNYSARI